MGGTAKKEYLSIQGKPVIEHSLKAFRETGLFSLFVVTVPPGGLDKARGVLSEWLLNTGNGTETYFVEGADTRQKSVLRGLSFLEPHAPDIVLIHDGARPWIDPELIRSVHAGTVDHGACLPLVNSVDALKAVSENGFIESHLDRKKVFGAQTPQGFAFADILEAHRKAENDGRDYVDDTEIYDNYKGRVYTVPGTRTNKKITFRDDISSEAGPSLSRIGFGYDLHRLVPGRKLYLGGVEIPSPVGEAGHSDGDVLIHALIDALFGAAGMEDIGSHFPPSDRRYKDISSRILLRETALLLEKEGWKIENADCTVVLERPKILPHRKDIIDSLADDLSIDPAVLSVKGKTKETVDAVGQGLAVEAFATVLLSR